MAKVGSVATEVRQYGEVACKVHWLQTPEQGRIAVTQTLGAGESAKPLLMLPGMFSNRRFWLSDKGIGLAAYLTAQGYSCWIMERRGLGESQAGDYASASLEQCIRYDLPAVQALIQAQSQQPALWMGHSFGGVMMALSLARGYADLDQVRGLVTLSSQLTVGKPFLNAPLSGLLYLTVALMSSFPSRALKMGPENEPPETMRDCARWVAAAKSKRDNAFWQGFERLQLPVLALGAVADTVDPYPGCQAFLRNMATERGQFVLLGREYGHLRDYDHVGMVVSKDAQQEVWPLLRKWCDDLDK